MNFYRGTLTDGKKTSTSILDLRPRGLNAGYIREPYKRPWFETPFNGIIVVDPENLLPRDLHMMNETTDRTLEDFVMLLRDALHRYWRSVLRRGERYLIFHSSGFDSRIMSLSLMELRDSGYRLPEIHFRCHQPEEPQFMEIMKRQRWPKDMYSVYEGPEEDYYDIGRLDRPLNGWQHYNQQMNFWSDIVKDEKDWIVVTGIGGEVFKYIGRGQTPRTYRVRNETLNLLLDAKPHEGQWEGYWRRLFKDIYLPFFSPEYLKVATTVNWDWCKWDGVKDTVRAAIVESYGRTHGVDCLTVPHGEHQGLTYVWKVSDKRKAQMKEQFYESKFYRDHKNLIPGKLEFFNIEHKNPHFYDGQLWGFMTCYEEMMK